MRQDDTYWPAGLILRPTSGIGLDAHFSALIQLQTLALSGATWGAKKNSVPSLRLSRW